MTLLDMFSSPVALAALSRRGIDCCRRIAFCDTGSRVDRCCERARGALRGLEETAHGRESSFRRRLHRSSAC